ncbi:GntR family transcriptional regulator [Lederbergia citrea]|uniref:GntR family transcriptional regulator n=1 Tax=Lederbergia citrea TaxID=2833581 RepID=A0A942Z3U9_9BACI|nr:GntR family transcriptional regulator [Lederbergia citrea]MBS4221730.1 GntR family transcriptional regulator [Lederbergia citrea]
MILTDAINKSSPLPLYYQLKELIKKEIEYGKLNPGDMIPSERDFVEWFEISRPTVRQAINELVNEGILNRKKGLGTFVAKPKISQSFLENLTSFQNEMKAKGLPYATKVIEIKEVPSSRELESIFGKNYSSFIYMKRLRFIKENPVVVVSTYIPKLLAPGLKDEDLTNVSLYETLQTKYDLKINRATRVMESVIASDEDVKWLELENVAAVMFIKTIGYLEDDRIFEYSIAKYRGDLTKFTLNLSIQ